MRYAPLAIAVCFAVQSFGQIIVTDADMPSLGDTMKISLAADLGLIDPEVTGAPHVWNFNFLDYIEQEDEIHMSVSQTNLIYLATFGFGTHSATYGVTAPDQDIAGIVSITDRFDFYKRSTNAFKLVGYGAAINGVPTSVPYGSIDTILQFPLNFGDKDTSYIKYQASIPLLGDYYSEGPRTSEVIGHGSVTTPYGTFNCLHVKSILDLQDTVDVLGSATALPHPITEYRWIANGEGIPIVYIIDDGLFSPGVLQIYYKDILRPGAEFSSDVDTACVGSVVVFTDESVGNVTSWTWDFGDNASPPNATGQGPHNVTYSSAGFKSVSLEVSSVDGTNEEIKFNMIEISGCSIDIQEFWLSSKIQVHPNPASDFLRLTYPENLQLKSAELLDMQGRIVRQFGLPSQGKQLDIRGIERGNYLLRVRGTDQLATKHVSISR